jgi:hypothetical protein
LNNFDQNRFSSALAKRLEEVFPVDVKPSSGGANLISRAKNTPLFKLKKILLSMEWEIEDSTMSEYLEEIEKLQNMYRNNLYCFNLLKLQFLYGKYIQYYKYRLPLNTYKRIYSLYVNTGRILHDSNLSNLKKKHIVTAEIRKFKEFKTYFSSNTDDASKQNERYSSNRKQKIQTPKKQGELVDSALTSENPVFDHYVSKIVLELKDFFKKELSDIKNELHRWQHLQIDGKK